MSHPLKKHCLPAVALLLIACQNGSDLPDYRAVRLQVSGFATADPTVQWDVNLVVVNDGGYEGIVDAQGNPIAQQIPILFSLQFGADRPDWCYSSYNGAFSLMHEERVPMTLDGNQYAFSEVFSTPAPPVAGRCLPESLWAQFDLDRATFLGVVDEIEPSNNNIGVFVDQENWPMTHIWTTEAQD
ncbi:MAG: hypothetical protein PVH96_12950 [Gemmatimonadota bacterium]|jgi:hypothetical protein